MTTTDAAGVLRALAGCPTDALAWAALADWLEILIWQEVPIDVVGQKWYNKTSRLALLRRPALTTTTLDERARHG